MATGPSTGTPFAVRSSAPTNAVEPTRATSAAGMRRSTRRQSVMRARTARPMPSAQPLTWPRCVRTYQSRCSLLPEVPGQPEELGELVDHDDHGDAGKESRDDGGREELGHPPEPQDAHQDHDEADHDREDGDEVDVALRARRREAGDAGGEQGGDGGVGPDRKLRIRAQEGEKHGPSHEGVEAGDRGHAGQARRGQLLGHRDGEQGHAGDGVRAGPGAPVAVQRRQHERAPHGAIFVHGGFPVADRRGRDRIRLGRDAASAAEAPPGRHTSVRRRLQVEQLPLRRPFPHPPVAPGGEHEP